MFKAIPGWLFLTLFVAVTVAFIDPIMVILKQRKANVEAYKVRSDAKIICFRDDFPLGRQLQACRSGLLLAEKDDEKVLRESYLRRLCDLDDPRSCYNFALLKTSNLSEIDYQVLLEKACRNGVGGVMRACGELAYLIQASSPDFAQKYLQYACAAGHEKFCK